METLKKIEKTTFEEERPLYNIRDTLVKDCVFISDLGESALKECKNITVDNCHFSMRYPVWHAQGFSLSRCDMDEYTRAALWYCEKGKLEECTLEGIKALRECTLVTVFGCRINSPEFGWRCNGIELDHCEIESAYFLFESKNIKLDNVKFKGKYSFQYVENGEIDNCELETKDAFWHCKNMTVRNTVLKGEYLGWYSENLTLENCKIIGTQPLCYCKNLKLINCEMIDCDLAFEYSDVYAEIISDIVSIKNPKSGIIRARSVGEIIRENAVYPCNCEIETEE